jgi:hypothetical protein
MHVAYACMVACGLLAKFEVAQGLHMQLNWVKLLVCYTLNDARACLLVWVMACVSVLLQLPGGAALSSRACVIRGAHCMVTCSSLLECVHPFLYQALTLMQAYLDGCLCVHSMSEEMHAYNRRRLLQLPSRR